MVDELNAKKMEELLQEDEFSDKVVEANSLEEVQALFSQKGVDVSIDDLREGIDKVRSVMVEKGLMSKDGELSEEMLELVSGGGWLKRIFKTAVAATMTVATASMGMYGWTAYFALATVGSAKGY